MLEKKKETGTNKNKEKFIIYTVRLTAIYFKSPSIILLFIFKVNNCDSHCITGIF